VTEHICKLARKGMTPSQIGVLLRDSHGIPQVRRPRAALCPLWLSAPPAPQQPQPPLPPQPPQPQQPLLQPPRSPPLTLPPPKT
jgi:hypothetical protein